LSKSHPRPSSTSAACVVGLQITTQNFHWESDTSLHNAFQRQYKPFHPSLFTIKTLIAFSYVNNQAAGRRQGFGSLFPFNHIHEIYACCFDDRGWNKSEIEPETKTFIDVCPLPSSIAFRFSIMTLLHSLEIWWRCNFRKNSSWKFFEFNFRKLLANSTWSFSIDFTTLMFYSWNIAFRIAEICQLKKGERQQKTTATAVCEWEGTQKTLVKVCKFSVDTFFNFPKVERHFNRALCV
jgi:hypothetical protein